MLSVKSVGIHGDESVFQAAHVIYGTDEKTGDHQIECYDADHERLHVGPGTPAIHYGKVYVMNDQGRTVAVYDLGGWEHAAKQQIAA